MHDLGGPINIECGIKLCHHLFIPIVIVLHDRKKVFVVAGCVHLLNDWQSNLIEVWPANGLHVRSGMILGEDNCLIPIRMEAQLKTDIPIEFLLIL